MPKYKRLCQNDRDRIYRRRKEGMNEKEIAEDIGFSASAVNREIKRNSGGCGYRSKQAGEKAAVRKLNQRREHKIRGELAVEIESMLRIRHSPEPPPFLPLSDHFKPPLKRLTKKAISCYEVGQVWVCVFSALGFGQFSSWVKG